MADKLVEEQRTYGFVTQTLIIGLGTWIASNLPWFMTFLGVSNEAPPEVIPMSVKVAFAIGALVFFLTILYTVLTTSENPPADLDYFNARKNKGFTGGLKDLFDQFLSMPATMKKLGVIQFFSWFAFFTMWTMANPAITEHIFNAPFPLKLDYNFSIPAEVQSFSVANTKFQKHLTAQVLIWEFMVSRRCYLLCF